MIGEEGHLVSADTGLVGDLPLLSCLREVAPVVLEAGAYHQQEQEEEEEEEESGFRGVGCVFVFVFVFICEFVFVFI